jgi:hypothetical protein
VKNLLKEEVDLEYIKEWLKKMQIYDILEGIINE